MINKEPEYLKVCKALVKIERLAYAMLHTREFDFSKPCKLQRIESIARAAIVDAALDKETSHGSTNE